MSDNIYRDAATQKPTHIFELEIRCDPSRLVDEMMLSLEERNRFLNGSWGSIPVDDEDARYRDNSEDDE